MILEKHGNTPTEQLAETDDDRASSPRAFPPEAPPFVLRFDLLPATPASLVRIRKRVEEINRRLHLSEAPFRLRMM